VPHSVPDPEANRLLPLSGLPTRDDPEPPSLTSAIGARWGCLRISTSVFSIGPPPHPTSGVADFEGNCCWSRLIDVGGEVAAELGALGSKPSSVKSAHSSVLFMRWCLCLRLCASVAGVLNSFARQTGVSWLSEHADTWFTPAVDFGGEDNVCAGIKAEAGSRRHRGHRRLIPN